MGAFLGLSISYIHMQLDTPIYRRSPPISLTQWVLPCMVLQLRIQLDFDNQLLATNFDHHSCRYHPAGCTYYVLLSLVGNLPIHPIGIKFFTTKGLNS